MTTLEEGSFLVKLARTTITRYLTDSIQIKPPNDTPESLKEKSGVFVTIEKQRGSEHQLRGCIGYPLPYMPLVEATIECSICSAVNDPRFPPLTLGELKDTILEVSVMTPPRLLETKSPRDYPKLIKVGRDGLIVESGYEKGLLLPQVPVEYGWNAETFLSECCMKACLTPDCWLSRNVKIFAFTAEVFTESSPEGEVVRKKLC